MLDVEEKFCSGDLGSFYLRNGNDHIKVDDQLNSISILDGGGVQVVPKDVAFCALTMMPE
jgi:hypothetical protein